VEIKAPPGPAAAGREHADRLLFLTEASAYAKATADKQSSHRGDFSTGFTKFIGFLVLNINPLNPVDPVKKNCFFVFLMCFVDNEHQVIGR
jgi:hypothetical protein